MGWLDVHKAKFEQEEEEKKKREQKERKLHKIGTTQPVKNYTSMSTRIDGT